MKLAGNVFAALSACVMIIAAPAFADGVDCGWKAGVAKVKITPREMVWMAGYGMRKTPPVGVLQDLWAKSLAIEDRAGNLGVIVTVDICSVNKEFTDSLLARLGEKYGIRRDQFILNCSHSHSGPAVGRSLENIHQFGDADWVKIAAYTKQLEEWIVKLVGDALADRAPAKILTGNGLAHFAVNRRKNSELAIRTLKDRKGPTDYSVPVVKVEDASGGMKAVLFGYACHPTTLSGYYYCGDYPGWAQEELERAHPGATALFFQGAGADQNPLPRRKQSLAVQYGKELAAAVEQAMQDELAVREPVLSMKYEEVPLAMKDHPTVEELEKIARGECEDAAYRKPWHVKWAKNMLAGLRSGVKYPKEYPLSVQYWTIGDQRLFAFGSELVIGYTVALKSLFGEDVFVMGYCNDVMNYIPSDDMWDEGGYEVDAVHCEFGLPGQWTRDVMTRVIDAARRLASGKACTAPAAAKKEIE